jgi:hypothetical protein
MVTVCLDNGGLLKLFKKKRALEFDMELELIEDHRGLPLSSPGKLFRALKIPLMAYTTNLIMLPLHLLLVSAIRKVEEQIAKLLKSEFKACKVFIVFNSEASQRKCLNAMAVGIIPAMYDRVDAIDPNLIFFGNVLDLKEAPEVGPALIFALIFRKAIEIRFQ